MDDYALVLNAGSSSLKFCVFQRPPGKAGASKRADKLKVSARRRVCPSKMPDGRKSRKAKMWRFVMDVRQLMLSPPGCDRNMAVRVC